MTAPEKIIQLVDHFAQNLDAYQHGKYNETQTRREFIDPFFKELGWDIDNESRQSELNKDVIHEDAIKVELALKAPDYSFRIAGVRKFFVEAKKPSVNIQNDPSPAYQLRRYGWSAKLPLSILTNFAEFAVYDCRIQPNKNDSAATARIMYLSFIEYVDKWPELVKIFSKDAIQHGAFDSYAEAVKSKKGTAEVDVAFLQEIEQWREQLAVHLALRNPGLARRELNYAVQRTIDRIVFLRICEDRGIEQYGRLQALQTGTHVYSNLIQLFHQADDRYNSGIFHFKNERDNNEPPDTLTPQLIIDDAALKNILKRLYYPDSPYAFAVIPAAILGQVYEQFLGKVITLDKQHRATVETKPEVKKAGGVYYTPDYIVEYIVTNTLGKFLNGKNLPSIKTLTILDPACGSGSFLIVAYQYLLDWYLAQYISDDPKKLSKGKQPRLYQIGNQWKLTITERKRILLAHIYGVDIDSQAIEVTKLSLFLKVLEGENDQTLNSQMALLRERVLPVLSKNIKCGNSLIGSDFYADKQLNLIDEEELYRVNVFDWNKEFSEIIKSGGFDIVIGNPPYFNLQTIEDKNLLIYLQQTYLSYRGKADILFFFVEKAQSLLNQKGLLGYIVAHYFLKSHYADKFRTSILSEYDIQKIIDFGSVKIFKNANVDTCILLFMKNKTKDTKNFIYGYLFQTDELDNYLSNSMDNKTQSQKSYIFNIVQQSDLADVPWQFEERSTTDTIPLSDICFIGKGAASGNDNIFVIKKEIAQQLLLEKELLDEIINDSKLSRYFFELSNYYLIRSIRGINLSCYPNIQQYLIKNKRELQNRFAVKNEGLNWYEIVRYNKDLFSRDVKEQIFVYYRSARNKFAFSDHRYVSLTTTFVLTHKGKYPINLKYLIGILNSRFMEKYSQKNSKKMGGCYEYSSNFLRSIPIKISKKAQHDKMVALVDQMLKLHKQLAAATIPQMQTMLQRQINNTDQQIDQLVYELYGLSAEEIKIIEEGV